jgi:dTDP-4-dehydrorhamnose reductase
MPASETVWITGASGLIGAALLKASSAPSSAHLRGLARSDLDLTDFAAVETLFHQESPSAVIHCAAMSRNPVCQRDPKAAWLTNHVVTDHLAKLCSEIPFVFFSTDLAFDGLQGNYSEEAVPNPKTVYAETKVAAEMAVLANPRHLVIRTSVNFGETSYGDRCFNEEMLMAWRNGRELSLFTDEFRSPISATVTANVVWRLLANKAVGLYHVGGSQRMSRFEIGVEVVEFYRRRIAAVRLDLDPARLRIRPESLKSYDGPPRCPDTSLNSSKVESFLGIRLPRFSEWIATAN